MESIEWRELMEEPPGGHGYGRAASANPDVEGRWVDIDAVGAQVDSFLRDGGWTRATEKDGARAGLTAHRGILDPGGRGGDASDSQDVGEYVDRAALLAAVEAELGFTRDDVHSVYRQGRLSSAQRELRAHIDARLLALSRSGANMLALARVLGLQVKHERGAGRGPSCWLIEQALKRARAAEAVAA